MLGFAGQCQMTRGGANHWFLRASARKLQTSLPLTFDWPRQVMRLQRSKSAILSCLYTEEENQTFWGSSTNNYHKDLAQSFSESPDFSNTSRGL